jgi:acyl-CoA thioesterase I
MLKYIKSFCFVLVALCAWGLYSNLFGAGPALIRIMPLGDSITQGNTEHNSYRRALWKKLQAAGYVDVDFIGSHTINWGGPPPNPDFDMDNEAYWGISADGLIGTLTNDLKTITPGPDVVLMHIGTNDLTASNKTADQTLSSISTLISLLRTKNPKVIILMAQIIPRGTTGGIIATFNSRVPAFAESLSTQTSKIMAVDQYAGFDPKLDTFDGSTHPNDTGEEKMATTWFDALAKVLTATSALTPAVAAGPVDGHCTIVQNGRALSFDVNKAAGPYTLTIARPDGRIAGQFSGSMADARHDLVLGCGMYLVRLKAANSAFTQLIRKR